MSLVSIHGKAMPLWLLALRVSLLNVLAYVFTSVSCYNKWAIVVDSYVTGISLELDRMEFTTNSFSLNYSLFLSDLSFFSVISSLKSLFLYNSYLVCIKNMK